MAGAGVRDILLDGPWRHREIAANGIRFHVAVGEQFSPTRPLILLLHGFGEFWWAWRHQIPALDAAGLSVAAMDLRGYGASDKTPRGYDPHTTAYDVAGVIKSLGFASGGRGRPRLGRHGGLVHPRVRRPPRSARWSASPRPHPLAFPWRPNLRPLAFFQVPLFPERRIMADDGLFIEQLLRSRAADGAALMTAGRGPALPRRADAVAEPALRAGVSADVRPQPVPRGRPGLPPGPAAARYAFRCCRCTASRTGWCPWPR